MSNAVEATWYAAGWNTPGYLPDHEPDTTHPLTSVDPDAIIAAIRRGRPHKRYVVLERNGDVVLTDYLSFCDVILHDDDAEQ